MSYREEWLSPRRRPVRQETEYRKQRRLTDALAIAKIRAEHAALFGGITAGRDIRSAQHWLPCAIPIPETDS
jgi:hypothetical protein